MSTVVLTSSEIASGLLGRLRMRGTSALTLAVVVTDQVTKAVRPAGSFVVNSGGAGVLPSGLGDALWRSPVVGAACDTVDAVILVVGLTLAGRVRCEAIRYAVVAILAGLLSNLTDRLGASALFHSGLPRGSIDWIPVPLWPGARANLADVVIAVGALLLVARSARSAVGSVRSARSILVRSRVARASAALLAVLMLAGWTTYWQANRLAATQSSVPPIAPATTLCSVSVYPQPIGAQVECVQIGASASVRPF